jgi:putative pyruvate formate lyase activating enzyme
MSNIPSYAYLSDAEWNRRITHAERLASACTLCPRRCGINRMAGEKGFCHAPGELVVSSIFPHHGEEPPISGDNGSGTIFFSYCTLRCMFCQNYQISHEGEGGAMMPQALARSFMNLQSQGCHNLNFVTATHFLPWILRALKEAVSLGCTLPVVYNNGGYERPETLDLLNGIVDLYLPDMKYGNNADAARYSQAGDYVEVNQRAIVEMFRQVGPLKTSGNGIARRGMCIRHLVLPDGRAHSEKILDFLRTTFDPQDISISLMAQYRPMYRAQECAELSRGLCADEYEQVKRMFEEADIGGFYQDLPRLDEKFRIDFTKRKHEPLTGE